MAVVTLTIRVVLLIISIPTDMHERNGVPGEQQTDRGRVIIMPALADDVVSLRLFPSGTVVAIGVSLCTWSHHTYHHPYSVDVDDGSSYFVVCQKGKPYACIVGFLRLVYQVSCGQQEIMVTSGDAHGLSIYSV